MVRSTWEHAPSAGSSEEAEQPAPGSGGREPRRLEALQRMPAAELLQLARGEGATLPPGADRQRAVLEVVRVWTERDEPVVGGGVLEILPDNYGFLRSPQQNYASSPDDIYVSPAQIARIGLITGLEVHGEIGPPKPGRQNLALKRVLTVNGRSPEALSQRIAFEDLTPLHPRQRLILETTRDEISMRVVDLVTPIGKGQRGLIVSPPRAGKTVLLKKIACALLKNHPECHVILLLVGERPEEVTDIRRSVAGPNVEVISATFDEPPEAYIHAAELVLERAKRMAELGDDVVILLDSITRLARAYNTLAPSDGKIMTGGLAAGVLQRPKRFFGAARDLEEAGSLTIIATALIDTGSKMDDVIFEEFKGTGNMEIYLDRRLVDRRVWPAIDINRSGTRREELLLDPEELKRVWQLRKTIAGLDSVEAMELLTNRLRKTRSNPEFLMSIPPEE